MYRVTALAVSCTEGKQMTVRAVHDYAAIRARLVELQRERETVAAAGAPDTGRREQERTMGPHRRFMPRETT